MPTEQIIAMLREERDKLDRAIQVLESGAKRRGRPPKGAAVHDDPTMPDRVKPKSASAQAVPKKRRRKFTAAQRKQQAERMKAYWAAKKKQVKK